MIIILTGPTGSGKTDTSWELLSITQNMVFLDCDWFASLVPFSWEKESDVKIIYEALSAMIDFYYTKGHKNFVITLTSQMVKVYRQYNNYITSKKMSVYCFRLRCKEEELRLRILKRDRINAQEELKNSLMQQAFFDKTFPDNSIFTLIDGSFLSERKVAETILHEVKQTSIKNK